MEQLDLLKVQNNVLKGSLKTIEQKLKGIEKERDDCKSQLESVNKQLQIVNEQYVNAKKEAGIFYIVCVGCVLFFLFVCLFVSMVAHLHVKNGKI